MRNDLHALDKLDVPEDWDSIRTRRPETPHDDTSQRGSTRLLAAAVAILVAIGGGAVLLSAFDKDRGPGPASSSVAPSPAARPLGTDGTLLYPELTLGAYEQMQQDLDSAHGAGTPVQVNPQALATQFAERVMGWEDTAITLEPVANDPRGATLAHARNRKTGAEATITLIQPVTVGVGGVWAVSSVVTPGAELDVQPGDIIANGSHVSGTLDLPAGDHAVAGFQVGENAASPRCL